MDSGIRSQEDPRREKSLYQNMLGLLDSGFVLSYFMNMELLRMCWLEWYIESVFEKSVITHLGFHAPTGIKIHEISSNESTSSMLSEGKIDVGFVLPEQARSVFDRGSVDTLNRSSVKRLFVDTKAEEKRFFRKLGTSLSITR